MRKHSSSRPSFVHASWSIRRPSSHSCNSCRASFNHGERASALSAGAAARSTHSRYLMYRIELRHNISLLIAQPDKHDIKTMIDIGASVFTEAVMYAPCAPSQALLAHRLTIRHVLSLPQP